MDFLHRQKFMMKMLSVDLRTFFTTSLGRMVLSPALSSDMSVSTVLLTDTESFGRTTMSSPSKSILRMILPKVFDFLVHEANPNLIQKMWSRSFTEILGITDTVPAT